MNRIAQLSTSLALIALAAPAAAQGVPTPEEHLGRALGTDFELADWAEVSGYYERLAAASPRVTLENLGQTTEGRDFLRSVITSERNHARLETIRAMAARIADPRGLSETDRAALVEEAPLVLFITPTMHATETAATEMAMRLAYELSTSDEEPWATAREELVVVLFPTINPDGLDRVVHWYREHVGTPYEATGLLELYQWYSGHDNNRDWFGLAQAETRLVTEQIYGVWHPQVYWDVHEQGSTSERFFVPPFRDPLNPNLDPGIITAIDALGSRILWDMTREGLTGISTGVTYDMWWNGGNRNVPVRHNIIGLLTEAAGVDIATPLFLQQSRLRPPGDLPTYGPSNRFPDPWPGGWWRLADIHEYELAFARSLLGTLSRDRATFLRNSLDAAQRCIDRGIDGAPRAWILPAGQRDVGATRRLCDILLRHGVELHVAQDDFVADGRDWPAGSVVILGEQPYSAHVKDLLEVQRYPEGSAPYDVAGWTLPLLLGVRRVEVMEAFDAPLTQVTDAARAVAGIGGAGAGDARELDAAESDTWPRLFEALDRSIATTWVSSGDSAGRWALGAGGENDHGWPVVTSLPRIGVYAPWQGLMNEGWLRWVLDTFELPFVRVRNEMLRAGELDDFLDVLIIPSFSERQLDHGRSPGTVPEQYTRGLDPEGAVAIEEFVRGGGTLVTMASSADWAIELFELPVRDVTGDGGFSCPGSVLRTVPVEHTLTAGLPRSQAVFFSRSAAWEVDAEDDVDVLLRYAPSRVLLSGWIQGEDVIQNRAAWVRARRGEGSIHLFAFRPQYRSWSQATFPLLFRAVLLGGAK